LPDFRRLVNGKSIASRSTAFELEKDDAED
jgi:hypothetical protein